MKRKAPDHNDEEPESTVDSRIKLYAVYVVREFTSQTEMKQFFLEEKAREAFAESCKDVNAELHENHLENCEACNLSIELCDCNLRSCPYFHADDDELPECEGEEKLESVKREQSHMNISYSPFAEQGKVLSVMEADETFVSLIEVTV